jgi:hypothetical protein
MIFKTGSTTHINLFSKPPYSRVFSVRLYKKQTEIQNIVFIIKIKLLKNKQVYKTNPELLKEAIELLRKAKLNDQ